MLEQGETHGVVPLVEAGDGGPNEDNWIMADKGMAREAQPLHVGIKPGRR